MSLRSRAPAKILIRQSVPEDGAGTLPNPRVPHSTLVIQLFECETCDQKNGRSQLRAAEGLGRNVLKSARALRYHGVSCRTRLAARRGNAELASRDAILISSPGIMTGTLCLFHREIATVDPFRCWQRLDLDSARSQRWMPEDGLLRPCMRGRARIRRQAYSGGSAFSHNVMPKQHQTTNFIATIW